MWPFMAALMTFGADRIMFSVDYPFSSNARARAFLDALPVSPADRAKIAYGNADRLMRPPASPRATADARIALDHKQRHCSTGG
jgi:predicted TIM-barrel fold metal-dependent hydrolase